MRWRQKAAALSRRPGRSCGGTRPADTSPALLTTAQPSEVKTFLLSSSLQDFDFRDVFLTLSVSVRVVQENSEGRAARKRSVASNSKSEEEESAAFLTAFLPWSGI